jgi:triacylglycerol esterase/lipase EstA (alpha/beta hydrolase family)
MPNRSPAILVHGIFGFGPHELGPLRYWGSAFDVCEAIEKHEASVGPISSAHDRACELAAQIKGTRVDYGAAHARRAHHARFGYDFTGDGFVKDWSEARPVHLIGHSLGSPTVRCLHYLLDQDFWGWGSSHRWVKSITTISGVSNGSTAPYFFGANERTGLITPECAATLLMLMIETYMFATDAFQESIYNFDLDQWGFDRLPGETLDDYLARVADSPFMRGKDNACYSLTLQGAYADNAIWPTFPDTYYFSYITEQSFRGLGGYHYPDLLMNPALIPTALYIGQKEFARQPIPIATFHDADWWENDGLVPTVSQQYPWINGHHPVGGEFTDRTPTDEFRPGRWYTHWEDGADHLDICITPELTQHDWQRHFYTTLFTRLAELPT